MDIWSPKWVSINSFQQGQFGPCLCHALFQETDHIQRDPGSAHNIWHIGAMDTTAHFTTLSIVPGQQRSTWPKIPVDLRLVKPDLKDVAAAAAVHGNQFHLLSDHLRLFPLLNSCDPYSNSHTDSYYHTRQKTQAVRCIITCPKAIDQECGKLQCQSRMSRPQDSKPDNCSRTYFTQVWLDLRMLNTIPRLHESIMALEWIKRWCQPQPQKLLFLLLYPLSGER